MENYVGVDDRPQPTIKELINHFDPDAPREVKKKLSLIESVRQKIQNCNENIPTWQKTAIIGAELVSLVAFAFAFSVIMLRRHNHCEWVSRFNAEWYDFNIKHDFKSLHFPDYCQPLIDAVGWCSNQVWWKPLTQAFEWLK